MEISGNFKYFISNWMKEDEWQTHINRCLIEKSVYVMRSDAIPHLLHLKKLHRISLAQRNPSVSLCGSKMFLK
jgi:hypothetical protein